MTLETNTTNLQEILETVNNLPDAQSTAQNTFSSVVVGSTTISADSTDDTLTLVAGSNITLTPDATNDKITIAATDTVYTHPTHTAKSSGLYKVTVDGTGHVSATTAVSKADITGLGIPSTLSDLGLTATATELNYVDGVTSAIQTQLNAKASSSHTQAASTISAGTFAGQVVAKSSAQTFSTSLLRNSKLVSTDTNPSYNGEICWVYA